MIAERFRWWVEGLATALLAVQRLVRRERRFRLQDTDGSFSLKLANSRRNDAIGSIEIPQALSDGFLSRIRPQTRGSVIEITVPPAAVLEQQLDPLPKESKPYIESVVRHQIETIFPWSAQDVLHTTFVKDQDDGKIAVTVCATSRSAVDAALSIATACEASEVVLSGRASSDSDRHLPAIRVPLGNQALARTMRARTTARYAIVVLLVASVCAIGWTSFMRWSAASELAVLEQAIADRRVLLTRASAPNPAANAGLEGMRMQGPIAVLLLDRLSELLPDHTYLTELSLDGDRLRISGISSQAAELVLLLEKSRQFRNASFYAPTTRLPGGTSDRFSIEAVINSAAEPKR